MVLVVVVGGLVVGGGTVEVTEIGLTVGPGGSVAVVHAIGTSRNSTKRSAITSLRAAIGPSGSHPFWSPPAPNRSATGPVVCVRSHPEVP